MDYAAKSREPIYQAFSWLIRDCEGTAMPEGYRVIYGHPKFPDRLLTDTSQHPRRKFHFDGFEILYPEVAVPGEYTTAAGAHQWTWSTWKDFVAAVGPRDFSPAAQDEAMVWRISIVPGNVLDLIESGDIAAAIDKLKPVWESFQKKPMPWILQRWDLRKAQEHIMATTGKIFGGEEPQPAPEHTPTPAPVAEEVEQPTTTDEGAPMIPALLALAPTLLDLASKVLPSIASLWTDDKVAVRDRNAQTAIKVLDVISGAVNAKSHQEAVNTISSDPAAAAAANAAILAQFYTLQKEARENEAAVWEREEKSRASARDANNVAISTGPVWRQAGWGLLLAVLALAIIIGGGAVLSKVLFAAGTDKQTAATIIDFFKNVILMAVAYFFGSSRSSAAKDTVIAQQANTAATK